MVLDTAGMTNILSAAIPGNSSDLSKSLARSLSISSAMTGTAGDDVIDLSMGNNTVFAYDGNNTVLMGKGNDVIYAGLGRDIIEAGDGKNSVFAGEGVNLVTTGVNDDLISTGSAGDFIDAGNGRNMIMAGEGNNRVLTGKGNDLITTGMGDDVIYSGLGSDTINAGDGNNIINAGQGNDTVNIGNGANKLILEAGNGAVTVVGFDAATDKLRLGESLLGKTITFVSKDGDTQVMAGKDLLATLKGVASGSLGLIDRGPLFRYTATDIGSFNAVPNSAVTASVNAASINDFGQVAGRYNTGTTYATDTNPANTIRQGFIWENGVSTILTSTGIKQGSSDLGAADGTTVTMLTPNVNTIGNRGDVLGTGDEIRQPVGQPTDRALIWQKDGATYKLTIRDFGGIESYAFDVNNRNQIPGRNIETGGHEAPLSIENGVLTKLADLGGDGGTARGINGKGQIVGYVDTDGVLNDTFKNTAIIWEKDGNGVYQLTNLGTFGGEQATLRDINNAGAMIGADSSGSGTTATSNPFLLRNGAYTALGSLGGKTGSVNGINEFGQVVGASQTAAGTNHAFVWTDGVQADLNNLITAPLTYNGAAVTLNSAVSINNFGDIVATGTYTYLDNGVSKTGTRSYVLKAV
jgi:probable HAF family extracellular repeat protein